MPGVAAQKATQRQPAPAQRAMIMNAGDRVMRATRREAATRPQQWGDPHLIKADARDHEPSQHAAPGSARLVNASIAAATSAKLTDAALCFATQTISQPDVRLPRFRRNASRTRRFMRLRTTAHPTLRVTVTPKRAVVASPCRRCVAGETNTRKWRRWCLAPAPWICKNSLRFLSRTAAGNVSRLIYRRSTRSGACDHDGGGRRAPCGRSRSPCGHETRGSGLGSDCGAGTCASWGRLPWRWIRGSTAARKVSATPVGKGSDRYQRALGLSTRRPRDATDHPHDFSSFLRGHTSASVSTPC